MVENQKKGKIATLTEMVYKKVKGIILYEHIRPMMDKLWLTAEEDPARYRFRIPEFGVNVFVTDAFGK